MVNTSNEAAANSSDRIQQLNDIDKNVIKLLEAAGAAVNALTISSDDLDQRTDHYKTTQERRDAFKVATSEYFSLLSSIDVGLRRQVHALELARIIPAEAVSKDNPSSQATSSSVLAGSAASSRQLGSQKGAVTGGGTGSLDVGWLNSRNDKVGKEKEAELWADALALVKDLEDDALK